MDLGPEGRTAVVIGATRGIGRAAAMGLAAEGTHVEARPYGSQERGPLLLAACVSLSF